MIIICNYRAHDNGRIVCGGADKQVLLMDVSTGQAIRKFRGHNGVCIYTL